MCMTVSISRLKIFACRIFWIIDPSCKALTENVTLLTVSTVTVTATAVKTAPAAPA